MVNVLGDIQSMCSGETVNLFVFIGNVILGFRILIPILLIIWGSIDLSKAVIAQKDDDIKKAQSTLMKRAIVAVVIFFLPAMVAMIIGLAGGETGEGAGANCWACATDPNSNACRTVRPGSND